MIPSGYCYRKKIFASRGGLSLRFVKGTPGEKRPGRRKLPNYVVRDLAFSSEKKKTKIKKKKKKKKGSERSRKFLIRETARAVLQKLSKNHPLKPKRKKKKD